MNLQEYLFPPTGQFSNISNNYILYSYWAAKSSNHSKPICEHNQRVPWASAKRLKPHSTMNYWAPTGTSKSVFSLPSLLPVGYRPTGLGNAQSTVRGSVGLLVPKGQRCHFQLPVRLCVLAQACSKTCGTFESQHCTWYWSERVWTIFLE